MRSASIPRILEPSPQGLIYSEYNLSDHTKYKILVAVQHDCGHLSLNFNNPGEGVAYSSDQRFGVKSNGLNNEAF